MRVPFLFSYASQSQNLNEQKLRKIPVFLTIRLAKDTSASHRLRVIFIFSFVLFFFSLSVSLRWDSITELQHYGRLLFLHILHFCGHKKSNSSAEKPQLSCQSLSKKGRQRVWEKPGKESTGEDPIFCVWTGLSLIHARWTQRSINKDLVLWTTTEKTSQFPD